MSELHGSRIEFIHGAEHPMLGFTQYAYRNADHNGPILPVNMTTLITLRDEKIDTSLILSFQLQDVEEASYIDMLSTRNVLKSIWVPSKVSSADSTDFILMRNDL